MDGDQDLTTYEVREVVARFDAGSDFEDAVDALELAGFSRDAIHMWASHDALEEKLGHLYARTGKLADDERGPRPIYEDRRDVRGDETLAVGVPVYIAGAGAGLAVAATGGTLAFAALAVAGAMAAGAGIGSVIARVLGHRHAEFLENQLKMGALLVWVDVGEDGRERDAIRILKDAGGADVHAHTLTRYRVFDERPLAYASADDFSMYGVTVRYPCSAARRV